MLIYDAACVLCGRSANFVAKRDRDGRFHFAASSAASAREMLSANGIDPEKLDAVVLIDGARAYTGSTAALRILAALPFPWPLMRTLLLVPRAVREPPYRLVARNRHRFFGSRACPEPHPRLRQRMLP